MRSLICICLLFGLIAGCDNSESEKGVYKLNPTLDANSPTGVYIPKDLEDCMKELEKTLPTELKHEIMQESNTLKYHLSLGMWIRNNWGL
jgi:hypothetical protein